MVVLGFPRGQYPCSTKPYQCSILLGDWKYEFCFGSGRAIFNAKTDTEDKAPTFRPHDVKTQLIRRDPDAGKHCWQKERYQKDETMKRYPRLNGHEFEETPKRVKDKEACFAAIHVIAKCQRRLSN